MIILFKHSLHRTFQPSKANGEKIQCEGNTFLEKGHQIYFFLYFCRDRALLCMNSMLSN